jgi:hypothetical protein
VAVGENRRASCRDGSLLSGEGFKKLGIEDAKLPVKHNGKLQSVASEYKHEFHVALESDCRKSVITQKPSTIPLYNASLLNP